MKNLKILKISLLTFISLYAFFSIRVHKRLNKVDIDLINLLDVKSECGEIENFSQEISCIKNVQSKQFSLVKGTECRGRFVEAGSLDFVKSGTGCCWDRSRLIEKTLQYYGFKVRHVHLNHTNNRGILNILIPNTSSHAVS